jgi:hypothetical protein
MRVSDIDRALEPKKVNQVSPGDEVASQLVPGRWNLYAASHQV